MVVEHIGHAQPVLQQPHGVGAGDDAAEHVQLGLRLEGVEQYAQRFAKERIAEIGQSGQTAGAVEQRVGVEVGDRQPETAQRAPAIEDS